MLISKNVIGNAAVISSSDNDATLLWHAGLDHMSERGLLELRNKYLLKAIVAVLLKTC